VDGNTFLHMIEAESDRKSSAQDEIEIIQEIEHATND
jgi:hypothetical protein